MIYSYPVEMQAGIANIFVGTREHWEVYST